MAVIMSIWEGDPADLTASINEQEYGVLQPNSKRKYRLQIFEEIKTNISLTTYSYEGDPVFLLSKCGIFSCTPILTLNSSQ